MPSLHTHTHSHDHAASVTPRVRRRLGILVIAIAVAAGIGLVLLWPRGSAPVIDSSGVLEVNATVDSVDHGRCPSVEVAGADTDCQLVYADVTSGPTKGERAYLELRDIDFSIPNLSSDDHVVLRYSPDAPSPFNYYFWDFQRSGSLWGLAGLFAVVVVIVGRGRGLRALLGLVASLGIIVWFLLPSLLRANDALLVALVATVAVAIIALYLAHGVNTATTIALLGTLASLAIIVLLAAIAVRATHLTGLSDESAQVLRVTAAAIDPRGLLIAGTVIGALGVLDDITVTQVASVAELHDANPGLGPTALYRRALRIGRDHIASTVNTLILAYVGASLPLLLFFTQSGQSIGRVSTREIVAEEIVRTLVGSIGLVLAVPITTALAAFVLHSGPPNEHADAGEHADDVSVPLTAGVTDDPSPSWEQFAPSSGDLEGL
jgi:uncharacterized membrane protein